MKVYVPLTSNQGPFADVPVLPDNLRQVSKAWLIRWLEWLKAGKPEVDGYRANTAIAIRTNDFNPALHPRDPETGKFVERPFDLPGGVEPSDFADSTPAQLLRFIDDSGGNVDPILQDDSLTIDGVPFSIDTKDELTEFISEEKRDERTPDLNDVAGKSGSELAEVIPDSSQNSELVTEDNGAPITDELYNTAQETIGEALSKARDNDVAKEYARRFGYIGDDSPENRAYNGPIEAGDMTRMVLVSDDRDTINHEMGHGVAQTFGYSQADTSYAWDMEYFPDVDPDSEEFPSLFVSKPDGDPPGFEEWRDEARADAAGPTFQGRIADVDELEPGDLIKTTEPLNPLSDATKFEIIERDDEGLGPVEYTVRDRSGKEDSIRVRNGELFGGFAEIENTNKGFSDAETARQRGVTQFVDTPDTGAIQNARAEAVNKDAEGKIEQLVSEANRAFFKMHVADKEVGRETAREYTVGSEYSSTNAHEVLSKLHETMQSQNPPKTSAEARKLSRHHPRLVGTYLSLFEPSEEMAQDLQDKAGITKP